MVDDNMANESNYQMAIDLLCCHLGITEDEAKQQLGLSSDKKRQDLAYQTQQSLLGLSSEK